MKNGEASSHCGLGKIFYIVINFNNGDPTLKLRKKNTQDYAVVSRIFPPIKITTKGAT